MNNKHILVVDDEEAVRSLVARMLSCEGFRVTAARDGAEALAMLASGGNALAPIDLLLTDVNMQGLSGLGLIDALKERGIRFPTLVMSGSGDETLASEVESRGCSGLLRKPFCSAILVAHIRHAIAGMAPCATA
jgi:CheY-like chemotaxis protein